MNTTNDSQGIPLGKPDDDNEGGSNNQKKKSMVMAIILIIGIIVATTLFFILRDSGGDEEENSSAQKTAEVIDGQDTPESTGRSNDPDIRDGAQRTITLPNGDVKTHYQAPDHITDIPNDARVQRGLAEHRDGDPIPADPREAVVPTLTAPTTARYSDMHAPQFNDPSQAPPKMLAKEFLFDTFSTCVKKSNSYNKTMRTRLKHRTTKDFRKRGMGSWADSNDHSVAWDVYSDDDNCSSLTAYITPRGSSVGGENIMYYDMKVNQRVTNSSGHSMNITPFRGKVKMKFINGKWLVDDFQVDGGKIPVMH